MDRFISLATSIGKASLPISFGRSLLHLTAGDGELLAGTRYLVQHAELFPVDAQDDARRTPLHLAARDGCLETVQCLCEAGLAEGNLRDAEGYTPWLFAVLGGHLDVAKYLVGHLGGESLVAAHSDDGRYAVHLSAQEGHIHLLKWLVAELPPFDIERPERCHGHTPFMLAARNGHATVLDYLLKNCEADPFALDNDGRSALHLASMNDHVDVCRYLIEQVGLDLQQVDAGGKTCIDYATAHTNKRVAALFMKSDKHNRLL